MLDFKNIHISVITKNIQVIKKRNRYGTYFYIAYFFFFSNGICDLKKDGFTDSSKLWLTYEETIDANTSQRPLQTEEKSRDRVGGASA